MFAYSKLPFYILVLHTIAVDISTLKTDGFVRVTYPDALRTSVHSAMDSWKNFCALPSEEKLALSKNDRLRDFGYMLRKDSGPRADHKELFHVSKKDIEELKIRTAKIKDNRASAFIFAIDHLIDASVPLVREFARAISAQYSLPDFETRVIQSKDRWTYRYLHYFGGDILAHAHTDRGDFTLHLNESHPGGECLNYEGTWTPWPVSNEETVIFPGMGLQYLSESRLKALCHRVQPLPETKNTGRYSMVAFIDIDLPFRYNDKAKRLQDFKPGFNYTIPHEEFKRLFVPY